MMDWVKKLLDLGACDHVPKMVGVVLIAPAGQLKHLHIGHGRRADGSWRGWRIGLSASCCRYHRIQTVSTC